MTEHHAVTRLSKLQFARMTVYDSVVDKELLAMASGNAMFPGARLHLNGADAIVAGSGCRSSDDKPSLALIADMFTMKPELLLTDEAGVLNRHNIVFAIPTASVADPKALMKRAVAIAATADAEKLLAAEKILAAELISDVFHQVDPGPKA